jgi:hypothetical protein
MAVSRNMLLESQIRSSFGSPEVDYQTKSYFNRMEPYNREKINLNTINPNYIRQGFNPKYKPLL